MLARFWGKPLLLNYFLNMDHFTEEPTKLYFYENRLLTFDGWPFQEDCACTPENVSYTATPNYFVSVYVDVVEGEQLNVKLLLL